jgi:hypothetical protein
MVALLSLFPPATFTAAYLLIYYYVQDKRQSFFGAINVTLFFLLVCVNMMSIEVWGFSLFWFIVVVICAIATLLAFLQYWVYHEIRYMRLVNGVLRLTFLLFSALYIVLFIWLIIMSALEAA